MKRDCTFYSVLIILVNIYEVLSEGYVMYCPCMGRFGNQADHFLGALGFAKGINRTLVLPPWVEYIQGQPKSVQVPFDTYFRVDKLQEFHDVVTMESFMKTTAPDIWPPEKRISFCYTNRGDSEGCNAKEGNPFGPFWDTFNIDFVGSEKYGPLQFDVYHGNMNKLWQEKYPIAKWPVLAFVGAPASFPVQKENVMLHKYLVWNDNIKQKAKDFIKNQLPVGSFVGIHLRNGIDWIRACEHVQHSPNLFAAPQCLGYRNELGTATPEMCLPSLKIIVKQIKRALKTLKDPASVFVASDNNYMLTELGEALKRSENVIIYLSISFMYILSSSLVVHMIHAEALFWVPKFSKDRLLATGILGYLCGVESILISLVTKCHRVQYSPVAEDPSQMMLQDTVQPEAKMPKPPALMQQRRAPPKPIPLSAKSTPANSWPIDDVQPCTSKSLDPYTDA